MLRYYSMAWSHNHFVHGLRGSEGRDDSPRTLNTKSVVGDFTSRHGRCGVYGNCRAPVRTQSLLNSKSHPSLHRDRHGLAWQRRGIGRLPCLYICRFSYVHSIKLILCDFFSAPTVSNLQQAIQPKI